MDAHGLSVLWYMRSKPVGKVRRRVQELRVSSAWYSDPVACKPKLDLSHNESARLAADSLLSRGRAGYQEVLNTEGEVDFLSEQEKKYFLAHRRNGSTALGAGTDDDDDDDEELETVSADSQSPTQCPAVSTDSDTSVPDVVLGSNVPGVESRDPVLGQPSVEVYHQSDNTAASMKDLVREFIRKASKTLAIVVDTFSDVELLCDLLEASRKRNVTVHLLLDHLNINLFLSMWQDLKLNSKHVPRLSVHSVEGQTYCAKTGWKLSGQITENFIISDWTEVLTGSYSFSWLSWQVHRNLVVLLKGSAVTPFHQEFQRLYSSSKPVTDFSPTPLTSHLVQDNPSSTGNSKPSQTTTICNRTCTKERKPVDAQITQTGRKMPADVQRALPGLSKPQSTEAKLLYKTQTHEISPAQTQNQTQMYAKPLVQAQTTLGTPGNSTLRALQNISLENPRHTACGVSIQQTRANPEPLQQNQKAPPKPLAQIQNQIQTPSKPAGHTQFRYLQPSGPTVTTAEKTVKVQESNTSHAASPGLTTPHKHEQDKIQGVYSQSTSKTNSNLQVPALHSKATLGLLFQESHKNGRLTKGCEIGEGINILRGQQNSSQALTPKADILSNKSQAISSPMSPQKQTQAGPPGTFTHLRGHTSGLETQMGTKRHVHPQRNLNSHLQSHPKVDSLDSKSSGTGTNLQPDYNWFLPGLGTKPNLQPLTPQELTSAPRLHWISQMHAARPTPVVRQRSFSSAYGPGQMMGGQLSWRPLQSSVMTSLGRSKSLNQRHSALFNGTGQNPNITKT